MTRPLAIVLLTLTNALWGSSYSVVKVTVEEVPPLLLGASRAVIALLILWPLVGWRLRRQGRTLASAVSRSDALRIAGLGIIGISGSFILECTGIDLTTSTDGALMIIGEVIVTTMLAEVVLREPVGLWKLVGVIVGSLLRLE